VKNTNLAVIARATVATSPDHVTMSQSGRRVPDSEVGSDIEIR